MASSFKKQALPLILTLITFLFLWLFLFIGIQILNLFPNSQKITLVLSKRDVLVGLTVYLKTSIDFAIFIANLMKSNGGWKNRIAIETGTALGNACGTLVVLLVWFFFKEVPYLMVVMIIIASFVLLEMSRESLEDYIKTVKKRGLLYEIAFRMHGVVKKINALTSPAVFYILPKTTLTHTKSRTWISLVLFSFSIPFILGLDDFAGYIPLFTIVNVYGFAVGVFLGHMFLNVALFISPQKTITVVKTPIILLLGSIAFVGIALWGFYEAFLILTSLF